MPVYTSSIPQNYSSTASVVAISMTKKGITQAIKSYIKNSLNSFTLKAIAVSVIALPLIIGFTLYARKRFMYTSVVIRTLNGDPIRADVRRKMSGDLSLKTDISEKDISHIIIAHGSDILAREKKIIGTTGHYDDDEKQRDVFADTILVGTTLDKTDGISEKIQMQIRIPMNKKLLDKEIDDLGYSLINCDNSSFHVHVTRKQINLLEHIKAA